MKREDSSATEQPEKRREKCWPDSKADSKGILSKSPLSTVVSEKVRAQVSCRQGITSAFVCPLQIHPGFLPYSAKHPSCPAGSPALSSLGLLLVDPALIDVDRICVDAD